MRGRSIQKSDGSREAAVFESVGTCPQTFVSFPRWKKVEERMSGVREVFDYAGCFSVQKVLVREPESRRCLLTWVSERNLQWEGEDPVIMVHASGHWQHEWGCVRVRVGAEG